MLVYADESKTTPKETRKDTAKSSPADVESKILIAYFTWAGNTVVEDESQIDVDATTSASVLAPGKKHLKEMFERIQHKEALRFLDIGCGKSHQNLTAAKAVNNNGVQGWRRHAEKQG